MRLMPRSVFLTFLIAGVLGLAACGVNDESGEREATGTVVSVELGEETLESINVDVGDEVIEAGFDEDIIARNPFELGVDAPVGSGPGQVRPLELAVGDCVSIETGPYTASTTDGGVVERGAEDEWMLVYTSPSRCG